jgi:exosortase A-associated hydrolase 2
LAFEPLFLDAGSGQADALGRRFAIHHRPAGGSPHALVLYVHPFAEEMNKSRRMAALQARAFAAQGFAVLQPDLLGCGDSSGDFGNATWAGWVDDVVFASRWLRDRYRAIEPAGGQPLPLWLWGLRAGALLAADAARHIAGPVHYLFWQPATSGKAVLQQFLRLKAASELLAGQARGVMDQLRGDIDAGRPVEVAGYTLHSALCRGLEQSALKPSPGPGRLEWLEIQPRASGVLSPVAADVASTWRAAGWDTRTQVVNGPAFWQTTEIEDAPALVMATLAAARPNA